MIFGVRISPNEQFIIHVAMFRAPRILSFSRFFSLFQVQTEKFLERCSPVPPFIFLFLSSTGFTSRTDKERSESLFGKRGNSTKSGNTSGIATVFQAFRRQRYLGSNFISGVGLCHSSSSLRILRGVCRASPFVYSTQTIPRR